MVLVRTDLGNTKESAHRERFEPTSQNSATNVQQAIANLGAGGGGSVSGPGSSTVNDFAIWNNTSGTLLADATPTVATALLNVFTSGLKGLAPASGGGTTNFLRADGTWAAPPGGGGSPAAPSGSIQYDNSGAFGAIPSWTNASSIVALGNTTTAQQLIIYNTVDTISGPTNFERAVFDWTTTANVLTIGQQVGGTGATSRNTNIISGAQFNFISINSGLGVTAAIAALAGTISGFQLYTAWGFVWGPSNANAGTQDTGLFRAAAKVVEFSDGAANANGWMQWAGEARVTSDVTFTSTTALATVTGLSVNVQAGRTYSFVAELSWTDAAAGGLQLAIAGSATATNIIYDGYIIDSGTNGIKGNAQATALGGAVASSTTTGTAGHARISGTITVNAAGTLLVQAAQNTSNGTATTIKRGSYFIVQDMP